MTVLSAPITIGVIVNFIFHSFFSSLASWRYLFLFSSSFSFALCPAGTKKSTIQQFLFFILLTITIALRAGKKEARPAEVGALASVFEKSASELKRQNLLKCKQTLQIATFNVRTLNRIGQLPELIASAVEHKIDIICIQEHRYTHTKDI